MAFSCTSIKWVLGHWFLFWGVHTNFYGTSTVLFLAIFWGLSQHSLFQFRAPGCPAAFLDTSACGVATTQPRAPLPSTQQGGWYVRLVWISSRQNPLKYPIIYRILFWRFFLVSVSYDIMCIMAAKLLLNCPLIHHNLPLILKRLHCGIIGGINNQLTCWIWCNSIGERGGLNN